MNTNKRINGRFGPSEKAEVRCTVCGKKMLRTPSRAKAKRFYCSCKCQRKDMPKYLSQFIKGAVPWNKKYEIKMVKCVCGCGREFNQNDTSGRKRNSKYYSLECYWRSKRERYDSEYYRKIGAKGIKAQQGNNSTSIEKKVYEELKECGLLFETQKIINGRFVVDAYIPSLNLVIEADGDYWHSLPKTQKGDKTKNTYLKKWGFNLLRLTETEINDNTFKEKIKGAMDG